MKVTRSVYEVLASYSSLFLPKLLWIDAICVDQNNLDEKALQVPLMQRIYQSALFTTVFLGQAPLSESCEPKHDLLLPYRYDGLVSIDSTRQDFCNDAQSVFDLFREFHVLKNQLSGSGTTIYELYEMLRPSKSKLRTWAALQRLLRHPWFQRVWIVQEVALSPAVQVRYGPDTVDWEIMSEAVKRLHRSRNFRLWLEWEHGIQLRHIQYTNMYNVIRIDNLREKLHPRERYMRVKWPTLSDVLHESFFFQATNPRDQIYGLIALCRHQLQVDYKASVEDTYYNAAVQLFEIGSVRTVLHAAGLGNRSAHNPALPTWVPDWREAPKYDMISTHDRPSFAQSKEERENKKKPSIQLKDKKMLSMSAAYIDMVVELGPVIFETPAAEDGGTMDEMRRLAKNWNETSAMINMSSFLPDVYAFDAPGQTSYEAFQRTMLCDKKYLSYGTSVEKYIPQLPVWEHSLRRLGRLREDPAASDRSAIYEVLLQMDDVTEKVESCCGGRRLFITQRGYMGLCPPYTMKGDLLHNVPGLDVALLLRRATTGPLRAGDSFDLNKQYYLVGEGYCHGVTNRDTGWDGQTVEIEVI
jgi:hypothetical protein